MPAARILLNAALSALFLGGGLFLFISLDRATAEVRPAVDSTPVVETVVATGHTEGISFDVDGVVEPFRDVPVAAEVAGRVVYKSPSSRVGRIVQAGETLMRIDDSDYQLEVQRLQQELEQAASSLAELDVQIDSGNNKVALAKEEVNLQQRELDRVKSLVERRVRTDSEFDATKRQVLAAQTTLQAETDNVRLLEATRRRLTSVQQRTATELQRAVLDLERTEIKAPIAGVITEENAEQDGYVQKGNTVFVIRDTSQLLVKTSLQSHQMNWLWASQPTGQAQNAYDFPETPVRVVYKSGNRKFQWNGVLARYDGGSFDNQTRMIPCLVEVSEPQKVSVSGPQTAQSGQPPALMVGMYVDVWVHVVPRIPLIRLPNQAVHPGGVVWAVADGKLTPLEVRIAESEADHVYIYQQPGSVQPGMQVVVSPLASPHAGTEVEVHNRL